MSRTLLAIAAALLLTTMRTSAHHAFAAEYDEKRLVTVTGEVTMIKWINPHAWLYVDGKSESNKVTRWSFEMGSPGGLVSRGWNKADLKKGDHVTVQGFGAKNGKNIANATTVTLPDGENYLGASLPLREPRCSGGLWRLWPPVLFGTA